MTTTTLFFTRQAHSTTRYLPLRRNWAVALLFVLSLFAAGPLLAQGPDGITVAGGNGSGNAANRLDLPNGVFVDEAGNLYVADNGNHRVQKFAPGATKGVTVAGGHGRGTDANQLTSPTGVFVDDMGNLLVADAGNGRIQKFAPGSTEGITVAGDGGGDFFDPNRIQALSGFFVDKAGNIYVSESFRSVVRKFSPGSPEGVIVAGDPDARFGAPPAPNNFNGPAGIAVDDAGNLYVVDQYNGRVQKFAPDSTNGVTVFGEADFGPNSLNYPSEIFIDDAGNIFISESGGSRVLKFAPGSTEGVTVAGTRDYGDAANQLSDPRGIFVDKTGNIFVSDAFNNRVQKFTPFAVGTPRPEGCMALGDQCSGNQYEILTLEIEGDSVNSTNAALTLTYRSHESAPTLRILINDKLYTKALPQTPMDLSYQTIKLGKYEIPAGEGTLTLAAGSGYICFREVCAEPDSVTAPTNARLAAETVRTLQTNALSTFPNPTSGEFNARFDLAPGQRGVIEVSDMQGRRVWMKKLIGEGQHQEAIRLRNAPAGSQFILRLQSEPTESGPARTESRKVLILK